MVVYDGITPPGSVDRSAKLNPSGRNPLSTTMAHIAVSLGAERVDYWDREEKRLATAKTLGAHPQLLETWPRRIGTPACCPRTFSAPRS